MLNILLIILLVSLCNLIWVGIEWTLYLSVIVLRNLITEDLVLILQLVGNFIRLWANSLWQNGMSEIIVIKINWEFGLFFKHLFFENHYIIFLLSLMFCVLCLILLVGFFIYVEALTAVKLFCLVVKEYWGLLFWQVVAIVAELKILLKFLLPWPILIPNIFIVYWKDILISLILFFLFFIWLLYFVDVYHFWFLPCLLILVIIN